MHPEDREFIEQARGVAGRVGQMSAALEREAAVEGASRQSVNLIAAGALIAFGNILDAICDELEARE